MDPHPAPDLQHLLPTTAKTSAIPENQEEQHIQTIRNKQKVKTTSDLSESDGKILENSKWKIEDD
jgi:hypothetical protein